MNVPGVRHPTRGRSNAVRLLVRSLCCWVIAVRLYGTEVGGFIDSNTIWTEGDSPFVVTNNVTVPTSVTLTIESGAIVQLGRGLSINAQAGGCVRVVGTPAAPVHFRSLDDTNNWGRLSATGPGARLSLTHADVQQGRAEVLDGASGSFTSCYFHDFPGTNTATPANQPILLSERAALLTVRACHFRNYYETLFRFEVTVIEDSLFEDITGDGIDFDAAVTGSVIRRCTIRRGPLTNVDAVDLGSDSHGVLVEDCLMYDFPYDKGVSIGESSTDIVIRGCVIYGVDMGVAVKDSSDALIIHNTIADCQYGFRLYEKYAGQGGASALAWNNLIWDATNSIVLLNGSTIEIHHSDLSGEGIYPGTSNLNSAPLFLDAALGDYRLATNSPCRGAGTNGATLGALFPVGSSLVDTDGDHLPDTWEQTYGLDFNNASDAGADVDQDGMTNLQEFWAGTSPVNAACFLGIAATTLPGSGGIRLSFNAASNRSYAVETRVSFTAGDWTNWLNVAVAETNRVIQLTHDADGDSARFYRLMASPAASP